MPTQVASLFGVLGLRDDDFRKGMTNARTEMRGLAGSMGGLVTNVQNAGKVALAAVGGIAAGAGLAGKALLDMAKDASVLQGIEEAFEGMVVSTGRDSREMLKNLREASAGMANQQDLMLAYNKAAQLVSTTFANQLPDAMDELTKVASATGQDMGFLMDSLVVGIGRLSPMILDNLGIQVSLTEAYEEYAAAIGKSANELSKAEQQAALSAQVFRKLEENTASLPSVLGQTDTKMAQFHARMANLRFEIGKNVLPVFDGLVTAGNAVAAALQLLVTGDFTKDIADALGGVYEDSPLSVALFEIRAGIQAIQAGVPVFDVLANALGEVAQQAYVYDELPLFEFLVNLRQFVVDVLKPVGDWISDNIRLQDILIGVGIAIASVVIPAVVGLLAAAAPIVLTIGALIGVAALLRNAWENNWLGIRDIVQTVSTAVGNFIQSEVMPRLQEFQNFLVGMWETVQPHLENLRIWFVDQALPAIVNFVTSTVIPGIQDFVDILKGIWTVVSVGLGQLFDWFTNTGLPVMQEATGTIQTKIDEFKTTLSNVWNAVKPYVEPIVNWFRDTFQWIGRNYIEPVLGFIGDIISRASEALELLRQIGGGAPRSVSVPAGGYTASFGASGGIKDSGGSGYAGVPYLIGRPQVGNELFIPSSNGTFVPDFAKMMANGAGGGMNIYGPITIVANDPDDFMRQMQSIRRRRG